MTFAETVRADTPRLVVQFRRGPGGDEQFEWGVVGNIPVLTLIGGVADAQRELMDYGHLPDAGGAPALVIAWDGDTKLFDYFVHPDVPRKPLVGMLEIVKAALVMSRMGQRASSQVVLGPNGRPMRG